MGGPLIYNQGLAVSPSKIETICSLLFSKYGQPQWKGGRDPLSELIATILSQNTSDRNSHRAFLNLKRRFPTWEEVQKATQGEIAEAIKVGGLSAQKANRIKSLLGRIYQEEGVLDLSFLAKMEVNQVQRYLLRFKGVGPKTAACVVLFSLGKPSMPVDTHILRVTKRLGLVPHRASAVQAQAALEGFLPSPLIYPLHLCLIEHGRKICKAKRPLCADCVLRGECDYPRKNEFTKKKT